LVACHGQLEAKSVQQLGAEEGDVDQALLTAALTAGVCLCWAVVSSLAILINKHILVRGLGCRAAAVLL
jgi:hypothetical protein